MSEPIVLGADTGFYEAADGQLIFVCNGEVVGTVADLITLKADNKRLREALEKIPTIENCICEYKVAAEYCPHCVAVTALKGPTPYWGKEK